MPSYRPAFASTIARLKALWSLVSTLRESGDQRIPACLAGTLTLVALGSALSAASPLALKALIDALPQPADSASGTKPLLMAAAVYVMLLCGGRLSADLRPTLSGIVDQRLQAALRQRFFDHVLNLPIAYLLQRRPGELVHSLDLAAAGIQSASTHLVNSIVPAFIEIAMMVAILSGLRQPSLVALFAVTAALYVALLASGATRLTPCANDVSTASVDVYARLNDGVCSIETLRCFTAEPQARAALQQANSRLESRWLSYTMQAARISVAASALFTMSLATCLVIAAGAVGRGQLTVGGFVLVSVYMLQMVRPLEVLGSAAKDFARALAFVRPLANLLAQPTERSPAAPFTPSPSTSQLKDSAPAVKIENLHFGYDPERPVIKGVSLEIQTGHTTAIVGRSGSGKSSLARLLMRLFSPQAGVILLDGTPIETIPAAELRARIGLVPQDTSLLHASIADNIALGMPEATKTDIERAARGAQLHDLITSLPLGYDTLVGERGLRLSGGERQRVAIARALLRRPTLFLLDEPTSMLDSKTEASIQRALRQVTDGCTTIVIAHRLSTIMGADDILVLDDGRILERGRHRELLAKGGLYAELWLQQSQGVD